MASWGKRMLEASIKTHPDIFEGLLSIDSLNQRKVDPNSNIFYADPDNPFDVSCNETESEGDTAITRYTMADPYFCPVSVSDSSSCSDVYPFLSSSVNLEYDLLPTTQTEPDLQPTSQTEPDLQPTTQTEPDSQSGTWVEPDPLHTQVKAQCAMCVSKSSEVFINMAEAMRSTVASLLKGIDRYNPENLQTLERYVDMQAKENTYDLEANLAVLKLYQFNPDLYQTGVTAVILLKALTNLPHSDFILCKCLIEAGKCVEEPISRILKLAEFLETANFQLFWMSLIEDPDLLIGIVGFEDSIRKFVCHVVATTYQTIRKDKLRQLLGNITDAQASQWISKYGWTEQLDGYVFITNQDENIKTKNITEKISFDSVAAIMAAGR